MHTQSKKKINMGKLSYPQELKYLEPLPISYPFLHCDFLKPEGWPRPPKLWVLLYAYSGGGLLERGGCADRKKEKLLAPKNAGLCIKVQTTDSLSSLWDIYFCMYLFTSQALWGKSYGWCVDVRCILNRYRMRMTVIFSGDIFLSQQNPTIRVFL